MNATKQKNTAFEALKAELGLSNVMQVPRIQKVVVSTGVGRVNKDQKRLQLIIDRLRRITGQAPAQRGAKKSIANFK